MRPSGKDDESNWNINGVISLKRFQEGGVARGFPGSERRVRHTHQSVPALTYEYAIPHVHRHVPDNRRLAPVMAAIRIPIRHRGPLALVASMSPEQFEALEDCFRPLAGDLSTSHVVNNITAAVDMDEPVLLLHALVGAWGYGQDTDLTQEDAARQVASSEFLEIDEPDRSVLTARLTALFHQPVLDLLAHAASIRSEDEYSYCTSRILSDLRPMFSKDEDVTPIAALIRHSLKFDVHVNSRIESVTIALNSSALGEITSNIERAMRKAESLREVAHKAGVRIVDSEEIH